MPPPTYDVQLWRGNPETLRFRFRDAAGAPIDMTGRIALFIYSWKAHGQQYSESLPMTIEDQTADNTAGVISVSLTKLQIGMMPTGRIARYEVEIDDDTLLFGALNVQKWTENNV